MEKKLTAFLAILWVFLLSFAAMSEAQKMDANQALSPKQQRIIPIAALTANAWFADPASGAYATCT